MLSDKELTSQASACKPIALYRFDGIKVHLKPFLKCDRCKQQNSQCQVETWPRQSVAVHFPNSLRSGDERKCQFHYEAQRKTQAPVFNISGSAKRVCFEETLKPLSIWAQTSGQLALQIDARSAGFQRKANNKSMRQHTAEQLCSMAQFKAQPQLRALRQLCLKKYVFTTSRC